MTHWSQRWTIWALLCLVACGDDDGASEAAALGAAGQCVPFSQSMCPCPGSTLGQLSGVQVCAADGLSYGQCQGCAEGSSGASLSGAGQVGSTGGTAVPGMAVAIASQAGATAGSSFGSSQSGAGAGVPAGATSGIADGGGMAGAGGSSGASGALTTGGVMATDGAADAAQGASEAEYDESETLSLGVAPEGEAEGVSCGVGLPVLCELGREQCCIRSLSTDSCIDAGAACTCQEPGCEVTSARCDGPEDCPSGQVCCGEIVGGSSYSNFACATSCADTGFLTARRVACHMDEADDQCPAGTVCSNSQFLTNLQVCIDPSTISQDL